MTDPRVNDVNALKARLSAIRARARCMLIVAGLCVLVCAGLAAVLSAGLLDYVVRLPMSMRIVFWLAGVAGLVIGVRKWILPGLGFKPELTEVALRLERTEEARAAGLTGVLTSGLELAEDTSEASEQTRGMARHVIEDAIKRFSGFRRASALSSTRVRHSLLTLFVCLMATAAIGLLSGVRMFAVGAERVLAPWSGVQWPKRTGVSDAMTAAVHPLGTALPLRAALTRTDRLQGQTRVAAKYRVISDNGTTPVTRVLLTGQGRTIAINDEFTQPVNAELFERLIEPAALSSGAQARSSHPAELEYWFETDDDRTEAKRIKLVEPPAIVSATVKVNAPAYAAGSKDAGGKSTFVMGAVEVGTGNDQHAVVGPVLAGSEIELTLKLNKAVPMPASEDDSAEALTRRSEWFKTTMPGVDWGDAMPAATFGESQWTLKWTAAKSLRLPVRPVDEFGLKSQDEASYSIDVIEDRNATAAVIVPREDEPVLVTAVVELTGEGRDDVGVKSVELSRQAARAAKGSIGAAPEANGEFVSLATDAGKGQSATVATTLDVSKIEPLPKPGEEVWITAVVTDNYDLNGLKHEPVRSPARKLRIIKEEELIEQIRNELSAVRKIAIKLDDEQGDLKRQVGRGEISEEDRRHQAGLTQRIATQDEAIQRLERRAERNKLSDEALTGMLKDLSDLLKGAAKDSEQAAGQMDAAARNQDESEKAKVTKEQAEPIEKAQESVREQLGRVAEALDRGEDSWLASRALQRVIQQQKDLKSQTDRMGEQTMGKKPEDLTTQERAELAQIAERQRQLSNQALKAIDQMGQRAEQMKKADPASAEAMKKAAERGRQEQVPQKMDDAAKNAEKNQTSEASREQQEAIDSMEQMAQDMNEAKKNKDAQLRRTLADVIQSLDRLITDQDEQIKAFAAAQPEKKFEGLDAPMITLNQNTLDVFEKVKADRELAKLGETVNKAADQQAGGIKLLRGAPVNEEGVEKAEAESLRLLKLAREEAKKIQDQANKKDQDKKRDELKKVYRDELEAQAGIRGDTEPYIGKKVERKDRTRVRAIGDRQEALRLRLEELKKKTEELADAKVFEFAHERLELATSNAAKKLRAAVEPDKTVARNQESAMRVLKSLLDALSDESLNDDEFKEDDGGGGGGGGGGGQKPPLIPPLVELKLLRGMQQEAADVTRVINESKDAGEDVGGLGGYQQKLADRGKELVKQLEKQQQGPAPTPEKKE